MHIAERELGHITAKKEKMKAADAARIIRGTYLLKALEFAKSSVNETTQNGSEDSCCHDRCDEVWR